MITTRELCISLLAFCAGAGAAASAVQDPSLPQKPKSPRAAEHERAEREIQGLWEVKAAQNPATPILLRSSGFMLVHDGWMSVQIVLTHRDRDTRNDVYSFVASTKRYSITDTGRVKLEDVWGVSNAGGELTPDVGGTTEERTIQFSGAYDVGQTMRIQRGSGDWVEFARRAKPEAPRVVPTPSEK